MSARSRLGVKACCLGRFPFVSFESALNGDLMNWLSDRTFRKYMLIQVPGWFFLLFLLLFLRPRVKMPDWVGVMLLGFWVVKDLALYPFLRQAYEENPRSGAQLMVGLRGIVTADLRPEGYIRVRGELWRARATTEPVQKGTRVEVVGVRDRLTLAVERLDEP